MSSILTSCFRFGCRIDWRRETSISRVVLGALSQRDPALPLFLSPTGKVYNHQWFLNAVCKAAARLSELGVRNRDVVAFQSPNSPAYPVFVHALTLIGAITSPMSPALLEHDC